jgi:hypothetical protein
MAIWEHDESPLDSERPYFQRNSLWVSGEIYLPTKPIYWFDRWTIGFSQKCGFGMIETSNMGIAPVMDMTRLPKDGEISLNI